MQAMFREFGSFRLGYTLERPYPWKWTTPIVLGAFLVISAFLAALNVPLSAYNIVPEFTYRPNDTLPAIALSRLVPSVFQTSDANSFTPQLLTVGDIIRLNGSFLDYTIVAAFDGLDDTKPVSSFSYYNNPFSDGCDVTNVTVRVGLVPTGNFSWYPDYQMLVAVTCRIPTLFHLVWTGFPPVLHGLPHLEGIPASMFNDFSFMFSNWPVFGTQFANVTGLNVTVTVYPCCDCDTAASPETTTLLKPPCSSRPPQFMATEAQFLTTESGPITLANPVVMTQPAMSTGVLERLAGDLPNVTESVFNNLFQNIFQAIYHFVRLDLGIVVDNQIYSSPQMFNLSIMPANIPPSLYSGYYSPSATDLRAATSNSTLMAQWGQRVAFYQNSDRVPIMDYLRPVPRLKPLASAITSVFVSTFAMLSVFWTIFSLGAGALARRTAPQSERLSSTDLDGRIGSKDDCGWDTGTLSSFTFPKEGWAPCQIPLQNLQNDVNELRRTLHGMQRLLEKQGLVIDNVLFISPKPSD